MRRDKIEHLPDPGSIGSEENPIKCNDVAGEREYLQSLIGINGEPVTYKRVCSMRKNHYKNVYDLYCLKDENGVIIKHLFIDMYHEDNDLEAPEGYMFVEDYLSNFDFIGLGLFKQFSGLDIDHISIRAFLNEISKLLAFKKAYSRYRYYPNIREQYNVINLTNYSWDDQIEQLCKAIIYDLRGIIFDKPIDIHSFEILIRLLKNIDYSFDSEYEIVKGINEITIQPNNSIFSLSLFVNIN